MGTRSVRTSLGPADFHQESSRSAPIMQCGVLGVFHDFLFTEPQTAI